MLKAFKYRIYPNQAQQTLILKTFGCSRKLWNLMLSERIDIYNQFKTDKTKLYSHQYKTEKVYKQEFDYMIQTI